MADAKDQLEASVFVNGTAGANQPEGIVTALTGTGQEIPAAVPGTTDAADVEGLFTSLAPRYRPRATWVADAPALLDVGRLLLAQGVTLPDVPASILGRPTAVASEVAAGTVILGDLGAAYVVADRAGFVLEQISHLFGANRRPTGQRGAFGWARVGAGVVMPRAAVMLTGG